MSLSEHDMGLSGDEAPVEAGPPLVVVLDTDPGVRWALERGLERSGYEAEAVATAGEALNIGYERPVAAMVVELLPEAGLTLDVVSMLLDTPGSPRVVCVSVEADPQTVIECMRRGAADFLPKPFSLADVRTALRRAFSSGAPRRVTAQSAPGEDQEPSMLIGISPPMQELRETIQQVAQTDLNCLIRGESGTGKDMVAREIHRLSRRGDKPFVKVNCTALPEQLLESELFGYEKGAFTGAVTSKPGRFELANRGVTFLDEIGEMHPNLQAKLLQVIEHKEFTKLGGKRHVKVDMQIIAATNADLEERTKQGLFRDDLYFRLNEVCIWVPALSARKEDVPLLVRHFIRKHGRFMGASPFQISGEDLGSLTEHDWPGNVRELESTIKRWLALGRSVRPSTRPEPPMLAAGSTASVGRPGVGAEKAVNGRKTAEDMRSEADRILEALDRNQWNRRRTAQVLGMSYQTLRRRIEKYGLNQREYVD